MGVPLKGFQEQCAVCILVLHVLSRLTSLGLFNASIAIHHINVILAHFHFQSLGVPHPLESSEHLIRLLQKVLSYFNLSEENISVGHE
jgi:hypothetical protein